MLSSELYALLSGIDAPTKVRIHTRTNVQDATQNITREQVSLCLLAFELSPEFISLATQAYGKVPDLRPNPKNGPACGCVYLDAIFAIRGEGETFVRVAPMVVESEELYNADTMRSIDRVKYCKDWQSTKREWFLKPFPRENVKPVWFLYALNSITKMEFIDGPLAGEIVEVESTVNV